MDAMIKIIGDSHTIGLRSVAESAKFSGLVVPVGNGAVARKIVKDGKIADEFALEFEARSVAVLFGNETYNGLCLRMDHCNDPHHSFAVAGSGGNAATILPLRLIEEVMRIRLHPIEDICAAKNIDWLISGPPPGKDQNLIRDQYRKKGINDVWIADPNTRLICWSIQRDIIAGIAAAYGATLIPVPDELLDEQGFLRPSYYHDGVHGNRAYNEAMLSQIITFTSKGRSLRP